MMDRSLPAISPLSLPSTPGSSTVNSFWDVNFTMSEASHDIRRRSVDTGGLALSVKDHSSGKGWGGWDQREDRQIPYAELLTKLYIQTLAPGFHAVSNVGTSTDESRQRLVRALGTWTFEPHSLSDDDVFACVCLIFEDIFTIDGLSEEIGVEYDQMIPFLLAIRSIYNQQNKYHNYQHALDVLQAMYVFLVSSDCVPPIDTLLDSPTTTKWRRNPAILGKIKETLTNGDIFTLCIAAIGHDVGHPGLNNAFMKNACTPLSQIYNHTSALERMHCTLLLQLMRNFGLGHLITPLSTTSSDASSSSKIVSPTPNIRSSLIQTVLATDMSIHASWMKEFADFSAEQGMSGPVTEADRILVCQALLKCADISNPARPHSISQQWSTALLTEWCAQAALERSLALPVSVPSSVPPPNPTFMPSSSARENSYRSHSHASQYRIASRDQAKGQIGFIDWFAAPLFKLVATFAAELAPFSERCTASRAVWQARLDIDDADTQRAANSLASQCVHQTSPDLGSDSELELDADDLDSGPPSLTGASSSGASSSSRHDFTDPSSSRSRTPSLPSTQSSTTTTPRRPSGSRTYTRPKSIDMAAVTSADPPHILSVSTPISPWSTISDFSAPATLDDYNLRVGTIDNRGVGRGLEAMRAAYRASARKRTGASGLATDDRFERRSSFRVFAGLRTQ